MMAKIMLKNVLSNKHMQERFDAVNFYHNQKDNDLFKDSQDAAEIKRLLAEDEAERKRNGQENIEIEEKNEKPRGLEALNFANTIELIRSAKLKEQYVHDVQEAEILENRKRVILSMLRNVLDDISKYVGAISFINLQNASLSDDIKNLQESISSSDSNRRQYHNRLISDIKAAVKNININFNIDFPEDMRIKGEEAYADRQGYSVEQIKAAIIKRELINFPQGLGGFIDMKNLPKDQNLERKYIAAWAFKIYSELSEIQQYI